MRKIWYQAYHECGDAHQDQREKESIFPSHDVSESSEKEGAKRPDNKSGCENCECIDQCCSTDIRREDLVSNNDGEAAKNVEVIPFNQGAYRCGRNDLAYSLCSWFGHAYNNAIKRYLLIKCPGHAVMV